MIRQHKIPDRPALLSHGLREMEEKDLPQVTSLYGKYMRRFGMAITMTEEEARHHLVSGRGNGPSTVDDFKTRHEGQVVWSYVVEVCAAVVALVGRPLNRACRIPRRTKSRISSPSILCRPQS